MKLLYFLKVQSEVDYKQTEFLTEKGLCIEEVDKREAALSERLLLF